MKNLDELQVYKTAILESLLKSPEIINLISGKANEISNADQLLYINIFPWDYTPESSADPKTYLSFEIDVTSVANSMKEMQITFYLITHQSLMKMENGTRLDNLSNALCGLFHGVSGFGIGKLEWNPEEPFIHEPLQNQLYKRTLRFLTKDFNLRPRKS